MTVLQILELIGENTNLKSALIEAKNLMQTATETIHQLTDQNAELNKQVDMLAEMNDELDELNDELIEENETLRGEGDEDACDCGNGHVNDTNANEDFLKEMALVLANDESLDVEQIPQLLTDIVTAIKVNTAR